MAKRLEQLKKIKMPAKPMGAKEAEMDLDMELGEMGEEKPEMPIPGMEKEEEEEELGEMGPEQEGEDMFKDIDDQMLIEEMKKRGLSLDDEGKEEPAEDEMA